MTQEIRELIDKAIKENIKPPQEFVDAVMLNEIQLDDETMGKLVDAKFLPRTRCEVWSRVMGYLRPVSQWNVGKKQEFKDREYVKV